MSRTRLNTFPNSKRFNIVTHLNSEQTYYCLTSMTKLKLMITSSKGWLLLKDIHSYKHYFKTKPTHARTHKHTCRHIPANTYLKDLTIIVRWCRGATHVQCLGLEKPGGAYSRSIQLVWIQNCHTKVKEPVCPTIYPGGRMIGFLLFPRALSLC